MPLCGNWAYIALCTKFLQSPFKVQNVMPIRSLWGWSSSQHRRKLKILGKFTVKNRKLRKTWEKLRKTWEKGHFMTTSGWDERKVQIYLGCVEFNKDAPAFQSCPVFLPTRVVNLQVRLLVPQEPQLISRLHRSEKWQLWRIEKMGILLQALPTILQEFPKPQVATSVISTFFSLTSRLFVNLCPSLAPLSPRAIRRTLMIRMMVGLMGRAALISISSSVMPMTESRTMARSSWFHL